MQRNRAQGREDEGQDRGGWRRGEEALETPARVIEAMWKNGGDLGGRRKRKEKESFGSVGTDLENWKKAEKEAQGAQGSLEELQREHARFVVSDERL